MLKFVSTVVFAALVAAPLAAQSGTTYRARVEQPIPPAVHTLLHQRYDTGCNAPSGSVELFLSPDEMEEVRRLGLNLTVLERGRPFAEIAKARAAHQLLPDTNYYTSTEALAEIDKLVTAYPAICRRIDLSALPGGFKTHGNRSIYALKISDNVASDEDEPAILIAAQHHARELNSPVMVVETMKRICAGYASNTALRNLVNGYEVYCVPCVNPDGTDYVWSNDSFWRKNRRNNGGGRFGVDLNRNYPFLWGRCGASTNTNSQIYRGPSAGSEPETKTMMNLARRLRPEIYIDFHSYGQRSAVHLRRPAPIGAARRSAGMLDRYIDDLRRPDELRHAQLPSASGEAPEWTWADGGAMSFLVEVMTSFQPSYASAVSESGRVWPGLQRAMTTWRPAVRGHVRSIFKREGVEASIRYTPNRFSHGERAASRVRDGRYGLWLPLGTHQVTFSAPGYNSVTRTVTVTSYDNPVVIDVDLIPTMASASITKTGSDRHRNDDVPDLPQPERRRRNLLGAALAGHGAGHPARRRAGCCV